MRKSRRPRWRCLAIVASIGGCVLLALSSSVSPYPTISRAQTPNACPGATGAEPVTDDFNGPAGTPPNPNLWTHHLGAGGDDGQLQAHTDNPRNASLDGNGNLALVTIREPTDLGPYGVFPYTSAWLYTHGKLDFCYGTVSARIKLPAGKGLRPAFFLLGSDFDTVGWPNCGEIDVMELPNNGSTLHGPGGYLLPVNSPVPVGTDFHEYAMHWQRDSITTSIDGHVIASWTPASLPNGAEWTFNDRPMYVILTTLVGGPGGEPDESTRFPATMLVDWMRYNPN